MNENDFITDPYFFQENITDIEVQNYNPRLPEPGDRPVDPPLFPMPPEVHPDPLPIINDNEPCHQASVKAHTAHDISSSSILVRLKDSQDGSSKKEQCITTKEDDRTTSVGCDCSNNLVSPGGSTGSNAF